VGPQVITLDTSAILALLNRRDPDHQRVRREVESDPGPYLIPAGILGEVTYMVEHRLGIGALDAFLRDIETGGFTFDCGEGDWTRIRELVNHYKKLTLGAADASVIACAERFRSPILTLDLRDFRVVAGEGRVSLLLDG
jgi:predicted nucleic acid-binding protein